MWDAIKRLFSGGDPSGRDPSGGVDLEADLFPVGASAVRNKRGEVELARDRSGDAKCEIEIRPSAETPAGTEVAVLIGGVEVCRLLMDQFKTETVLRTQNGDPIPPARAGDAVEVAVRGAVVLRGVFRPD